MSSFDDNACSASRSLKTAGADFCKKFAKNRGRIALGLAALSLVALLPLTARAQNNAALMPLNGGDFEAPIYNASPFFRYAPAGDGTWMWSGFAGIQHNGKGWGAATPQGEQTAFLHGGSTPGRMATNLWLKRGHLPAHFQSGATRDRRCGADPDQAR